MPVPAQIMHGGHTDTPGFSPAISRCIHSLLQDVLEYSQFLHGGARRCLYFRVGRFKYVYLCMVYFLSLIMSLEDLFWIFSISFISPILNGHHTEFAYLS